MKVKEIRKQKHPIWPYLSSSDKLRLAFSLSGPPPQAEGSPLSSFFSSFFCSCLPQQASRCFLPSTALLCSSQPPISRLKKRKKKKTKKLPPASQPQGGSTICFEIKVFEENMTIYLYKNGLVFKQAKTLVDEFFYCISGKQELL